jgi:hypothetical protein
VTEQITRNTYTTKFTHKEKRYMFKPKIYAI